MDDSRVKFWGAPASWPIDGPDATFLARAVQRVGSALFPNLWTRREPITPEPYGFFQTVEYDGRQMRVPRFDLKSWELRRIRNLAWGQRPELTRIRGGGSGATKIGKNLISMDLGKEWKEITDEEKKLGLEISEKLDAEREPARSRFAAVKSTMIAAFREDRLEMILRPKAGGYFSEAINPIVWNTEVTEPRFYFCQFNPSDPFGIGVGGSDYQFIYVTTNSLETLLRSISAPVGTAVSKPDGIETLEGDPAPMRSQNEPIPAAVKRPASEATIKKAIAECLTFAAEREFAAPSRDEFIVILQDIYKGTSREKIRRTFEDREISDLLPDRKGPRGPRNFNRNNEMEEFRQFLSAAKLRN